MRGSCSAAARSSAGPARRSRPPATCARSSLDRPRKAPKSVEKGLKSPERETDRPLIEGICLFPQKRQLGSDRIAGCRNPRTLSLRERSQTLGILDGRKREGGLAL